MVDAPLPLSLPTGGPRGIASLPESNVGTRVRASLPEDAAEEPMTLPRFLVEQEGKDARLMGWDLVAHNPFPPKTTAWVWWRRGWFAQDRAQAESFGACSEQPAGVEGGLMRVGAPCSVVEACMPAAESMRGGAMNAGGGR